MNTVGAAHEGWVEIEGVLMTTEPIEAYGGVQFHLETLESIVAQLESGEVPLAIDHDHAQELRARSLGARILPRPDGFHELRVKWAVHPEDAQAVQSRRGLSAAITHEIPGRDKPAIVEGEVTGDHAWFADDVIEHAGEILAIGGPRRDRIHVARLLQFSFIPDAQIYLAAFIETASTVGIGILTNAMWDALKFLLANRRTPPGADPLAPTRINLEMRSEGRKFKAVVETSDPEVAREAVESFGLTAASFFSGAAEPGDAD